MQQRLLAHVDATAPDSRRDLVIPAGGGSMSASVSSIWWGLDVSGLAGYGRLWGSAWQTLEENRADDETQDVPLGFIHMFWQASVAECSRIFLD